VSGTGPWVLLLLCVAATCVWRLAGVAISSRIDSNGSWLQWFNCVAYAMLAGLITRVILIPEGMLAQTPITHRLIAMAVGFLLFALLRRNVFAATASAFLVFLVLSLLSEGGFI